MLPAQVSSMQEYPTGVGLTPSVNALQGLVGSPTDVYMHGPRGLAVQNPMLGASQALGQQLNAGIAPPVQALSNAISSIPTPPIYNTGVKMPGPPQLGPSVRGMPQRPVAAPIIAPNNRY